ncbi:MAG TPA: DNA polymerase I [bacterium]|nr:DNA polymerase I [bacterium]
MSADPQQKRLVLVDGAGYAYRAFYAIRALSNSKGHPTNAVYGFVRMLLKLVAEHKPDYLAVCFDVAAPTFRHNEFAGYKAHRKPTPPELVVQLPLIREAVGAYNVPIVEKAGFEADDVIATLARQGERAGMDVLILTGDKDMMQLVGDRIRIISAGKEDTVYDAAGVREKFGVPPEGIRDLLCLTGDASDNVPGVKGVGPKTAAALIADYGTLERLYERLDEVKSAALREKLLSAREAVFANRRLIAIKEDIDTGVTVADLAVRPPDIPKLAVLFKELEFTGLLKDILVHEEAPGTAYRCVTTSDDLGRLACQLAKSGGFVIDTETTDVDPMRAELVGAAFCWDEADSYYVALGHGIDGACFAETLRPVLENPAVKKFGHNVKYDRCVLLNAGIDLRGIQFDTMIAHYLLNPSKLRHNLGELAMEYLGCKMTSIRDLIGEGKKRKTMRDVPLEEVSRYACEDAVVTLRLKKLFERQLADRGVAALFRDIEMPLVDVLVAMEREGIAIDEQLLRDMGKDFEAKLSQLLGRIYILAGEEFNVNSPKALAQILFEKLKLPQKRKTKTGYSTDVDVLTSLARSHELPQEILAYRQLAKLKSTYIDVLPTLVNPRTGRVHTSFHQAVTATGRLSSSDPNLQNIPVKTELGREIRRAFVPRGEGYSLVGADYSQIELRILAHLSQDQALIHAFRNDIDIHNFTAGLVFGADTEAVTDDMRRKAKVVNFGIIYGMSPYGHARDLVIADADAKAFIDEYFKRYPGVYQFIQDTVARARHDKYVTTLFHRKRFIPDIQSANFAVRQFSERTAINTPIQGSAADIIKLAMIQVAREIQERGMRTRMLLQIHDELILDVPRDELILAQEMVRRRMEGVVKLDVPIRVAVSAGKSWAEI